MEVCLDAHGARVCSRSRFLSLRAGFLAASRSLSLVVRGPRVTRHSSEPPFTHDETTKKKSRSRETRRQPHAGVVA